jgi:hypothetical protein
MRRERDHIAAELISGKVHGFGGRFGSGFQSDKTVSSQTHSRDENVAGTTLSAHAAIRSN